MPRYTRRESTHDDTDNRNKKSQNIGEPACQYLRELSHQRMRKESPGRKSYRYSPRTINARQGRQ